MNKINKPSLCHYIKKSYIITNIIHCSWIVWLMVENSKPTINSEQNQSFLEHTTANGQLFQNANIESIQNINSQHIQSMKNKRMLFVYMVSVTICMFTLFLILVLSSTRKKRIIQQNYKISQFQWSNNSQSITLYKPNHINQQATNQIKFDVQLQTNIKFEQFQHNIYTNQLITKSLDGDKQIQAIQYMYYKQKYKIKQQIWQKSICIISQFPTHSKQYKKQKMQIFMRSINWQNYSNYKITLIVDGQALQHLQQILFKSIYKYRRVHNRMIIVKLNQNKGEMNVKDLAIRNFCNSDDIILQIDVDMALKSRQVLQICNHFYHQFENLWFAQFSVSSQFGNQLIHQPIHYAQNLFEIKALYSYKQKLYTKIPSTTQNRHIKKSALISQLKDILRIEQLRQLAGSKHSIVVEELLCLINITHEDDQCKDQVTKLRISQLNIAIPFASLDNLNQQAKYVSLHQIPILAFQQHERIKMEYQKCILFKNKQITN